MKAAAAASFSSAWAQASPSASHSNGSSSGEAKSQQDLTNSMAWEAIGGDFLLCNNPPEWCATVGDFYNWRVIEQNGVLPLYKVLSLFDGFDGIRHRFEASAQDKYEPNRWVRFKFELFDRTTQNPLALYKDDKLLWEHLNTEFSKLRMASHPLTGIERIYWRMSPRRIALYAVTALQGAQGPGRCGIISLEVKIRIPDTPTFWILRANIYWYQGLQLFDSTPSLILSFLGSNSTSLSFLIGKEI
ncbi:hypothetical protein BDW59DRAFT_166939 [Aspergillus cavernicola]|uniref:Uncharacterized protein n=1 Tax=Aspergillus cavernicola TaxID=176166 RepID=A0ABR4HI74_9EURO